MPYPVAMEDQPVLLQRLPNVNSKLHQNFDVATTEPYCSPTKGWVASASFWENVLTLAFGGFIIYVWKITGFWDFFSRLMQALEMLTLQWLQSRLGCCLWRAVAGNCQKWNCLIAHKVTTHVPVSMFLSSLIYRLWYLGRFLQWQILFCMGVWLLMRIGFSSSNNEYYLLLFLMYGTILPLPYLVLKTEVCLSQVLLMISLPDIL